ncbi:MAG TPA: extracellular solute-binding protein [Fimbriimonadaceae bacterium]|jgi:ABC-type glycerol-3-phosphate transport system substrate-binding protein
MTTKLGLSLLAVGAVVVAAAVYGDMAVSRQGESGKVTVVYWEKWTGAEGEAMQRAVNDFNASQNRIFVQYLSISDIDKKTLLAAAGSNPPDVAGIWQDQVAQFADAKALTDLTDLAAQNNVKASDYIPSFYDGLVYHDRLWALPSTPSVICLYVRADLVPKEYATQETFPKTIEAFDDLMFKISTKNSNGTLKMAGFLPASPGWYPWAWGPLFGGKLFVGDKLTINSPENLKAFEWTALFPKNLGAQTIASFQSGFGAFATPQDPFLDGKTACEINGVWKAGYINGAHKTFPWFVVPFPYPKDHPELANHAFINEDVLVIPRGTKHPKEAFEFVKFIQRQDVMERLCAAQGKNTALAKVSENFFKTHQNREIRYLDHMARSSNVIPAPQIGIFPQIRNEISVAAQEINTDQKSAKQALDDAQNRLEGQWQLYRTQILGDAK